MGTSGACERQRDFDTARPQAILGAHVGDLDNLLSVDVHRRAVQDLLHFFKVVPGVVACDMHPDYASTRHAERLSAGWKVPLVRVQHHHAHVAACMAEHKLEGPVLGLAWDGTGYGTDATVWGGEALVCDGAQFTRVARLRTFLLAGGDRAVREPRRSALGVLFEIFGDRAGQVLAEAAGTSAAGWFEARELDTLVAILARRVHCPPTSSMGRLFDAVAALCGLPAVTSFEGQAAMALEYAAWEHERGGHPLPLSSDTPAVADWEPLIRAVLAERAAGVPVGRTAARFHNALAEMAVAVATRHGVPIVALSGGCFQNALLTARVRARLLQSGFRVYTHRQIPPGDGGLALGQLYVAALQMKESHRVSGHSR
jgi:hydrogenase maturation protein HypF